MPISWYLFGKVEKWRWYPWAPRLSIPAFRSTPEDWCCSQSSPRLKQAQAYSFPASWVQLRRPSSPTDDLCTFKQQRIIECQHFSTLSLSGLYHLLIDRLAHFLLPDPRSERIILDRPWDRVINGLPIHTQPLPELKKTFLLDRHNHTLLRWADVD